MTTEIIVFVMCSNPTDKQMDFFQAKMVFAYHTVIIPSDIKNHSFIATAKQISRPECLYYIIRKIPISIFYCC